MLRQQFIRYLGVGFCLNAALYASYLLLTWRGMGDRAAMTITFCAGVLLSFIANRNLTFRHNGGHLAALRRFIACYIILYMFDFVALWVFAEQLGVAPQVVQGCAIPAIAVLAFVLQRFWVFRPVEARIMQPAVRTGP